MENSNKIEPQTYFDKLKEGKETITDEFLRTFYINCEILLKKAYVLGQDVACKKIMFTIDVIEKEKKLLNMGFNTFLYRDDIEYYLNNVNDKVVKIIELKNYPREIPDEIVGNLIKLKEENIFDEYFIVFTDYTGEVEREVENERKRKDPILFGIFTKNNNLHDRFYYIGDWEDEYCDLTLSKMVDDMTKKGKTIKRKVGIQDSSIEEIKEYLNSLESKENNKFTISVNPPKKSLFQNVKLWFTK